MGPVSLRRAKKAPRDRAVCMCRAIIVLATSYAFGQLWCQGARCRFYHDVE